MMESITLDELTGAIDGVPLTPIARGASVRRVGIVSQDIVPGDLFWSLGGEPIREARHVALAESRGSVAAVMSPAAVHSLERGIVVKDPRAALLRLAGWYRTLLDAFVIGVSGGDQVAAACDFTRAIFGIHPLTDVEHSEPLIALAMTLLDVAATDHFAVVNITGRSDEECLALANVARPDVIIIAPGGAAGSPSAIAALMNLLPSGGLAIVTGEERVTRGRGFVACQMRRPNRRAEPFGLVDPSPDHSPSCEREIFHFSTEIVAPERLRVHVNQSYFDIIASGRDERAIAAMAAIAARRLGRFDDEITRDLARFYPTPARVPLAA